ncbi:hypothetical protein E8E11_008040 [Didymella keratinophila]|nr:hypothetical protein E8E11_008040 [Didymella keratinophila]
MNYERDAEGGQRWLPADIAHIRNVGKNLHRDIFALRRWQRIVAQQGDQDKVMMMHIKREANFVKLLCERVQSAIAKCEQKCNLELLRDGVYAQDEDGNLYKPIAPREFVAEGGYLHNVSLSSNEGVEDGSWERHQDYNQDYNQDRCPDYSSAATFGMPPDTGPSTHSKRNLTFDFAFQSTPFDRLKREATYQPSEQPYEQPITPRSNRIVDGRISKPHRECSRRRKTDSPSPDPRDQSPASVCSLEGIKPRSRGKNNFNDRNGVSRRQAKRDRARNRPPPPTIGHLVCIMGSSPAWNHQTSKGATRKLQARDYTVGCALPVEFAAADEMLDEEHVAPDNVDDDDPFVYTLGRIHDHNVVLTCLPDGSMGTQPAAIVAARMRSKFTRIKFGLMTSWFNMLEDLSRDSAGNGVLSNADYEHPGGSTCKFCSNVEKVVRPARNGNAVVEHYGTITSGNQVMKDRMRRDKTSKELGGFDMETAGLMNDFPCVVIRRICDYADSHKNKTWQPYAAATAAACAKEMLTFVPALSEPIMPKSGHTTATGQARVLEKLDILMKELQLAIDVGVMMLKKT